MTLFSFLSWFLSARKALSLMTAVVQSCFVMIRYVLGLVYDAIRFGIFFNLGLVVFTFQVGIQPVRVIHWFIVVFSTRIPGATRIPGTHPNGRTMHRKFLSRGTCTYLHKLNLRFMVFSAYQICPAWAYVFQCTDTWFSSVFRRIVAFESILRGIQHNFVEAQYWFLPSRASNAFGFSILLVSLGLVSITVAFKLLRIRLAHKSKSNDVTTRRIKVTVPTKFRLRGRYKSSTKHRRCVYTTVNQIFVLETSLDDLKKGDNFTDSTVCMVDNCANTHIWNCKDDFIPGSLKPINRMSSVATIGGSNFYPDSVGQLPVTWNDGKGGSYSIVLDDVLYFFLILQ